MPTKRPSSKKTAAKKSTATPASRAAAISAAFDILKTAKKPLENAGAAKGPRAGSTSAKKKQPAPATAAKKKKAGAAKTPIAPVRSAKPIPISRAFAIAKARKNAGELRNPDKPAELQFALDHLDNIRLFRKDGFSYKSILDALAAAGADVSELDPEKMSDAVNQAVSTVKRRAQRQAERQKRLAAAEQ